MIKELYYSLTPNKRFRAVVHTKQGIRNIDFGQRGGFTYIDGATEETRKNYRLRHYPLEKRFINNLILSPALLSWYILWGESRDLKTNVFALNKKWKDIEKI